MAKHRTLIAVEHDEGQEARVTLGAPGGGDDASWFRLFRGIVRSGTWAGLGPAARAVLVVLAEAVNDQLRRESGQWLAWPSVPTIARRAGLAERNVYVALRELKAKDLIRAVAVGGGRRQTTYELRAPKLAERDAVLTPPSPLTRPSGVTAASAVPRTPRQVSPDAGDTQQRKSGPRMSDSSASRARAGLAEAGVEEPMLSRLAAEHDEPELLLRLEDWWARRAAGSKLGVAWLIASIRDRYELHPSTHAANEKRAAARAADERRRRAAAADEAEARRQRALDARAEALFDAMSDEELAHWKAVVVAEFPALVRNADRADPRAHDGLRRLILAKLIELVCPPEPRGAPAV